MSNVVVFKAPPTRQRRASSRFLFTEARLDQLKPTGRETVHHDTRSPLSVRITPTGTKSYLLYQWIDSRPLKMTLGRVGEVGLEDARLASQQAKLALAAGKDPVAERKAKRARGMTVVGLWEDWKGRQWSALKPRTQDSFESLWRLHIEPAIGNEPVKDLARAKIRGLIDGLVAKGKPATARKVKALVHLLMNAAIELEVITANPAARVKAPVYRARSRVMSVDERGRLLAAIDDAPEPWADFFRLLLLTASRVTALSTMRWTELDLQAGTWTIPPDRNKSGRTIVLPLVPEAIEILQARKARHMAGPWVFPGRGREGHITYLQRGWTRVLERAGIEGLRRHDLRRSVGTLMAEQQASEYQIALALGHTSLSAVKHYVHLAGTVARSAMTEAASVLPKRK